MKKKKRICMALAAALSMSLAISATALAAIPSDIGGHWAQGTIIQWTSNGYIAGYPDGTFKPDNSITRAEFVVLVNKAMGYNDRGNAYFSDVSASHWAYAEIMKGVEAGYITGNGDGTFRPDAPVTRQEAAVMISKILGLGQDFASAAKYADYRYIPSWAAGYVGAVTNAGIMSGYPDGDFKADRVLTRAEAVISLDKTMNYDNKTEEDDREVFEGYRLTSTSLSDKIIKGDLIISSTLSSRDVSLDNVKVEGKLIVDGGKTITADDCEINKLEMSKNDAEFVAEGKTTVKETTFEKYGKLMGSGYSKVIIDNEFNSYIELDAEIDYVELDAETNVRLLSDCVIETFEATGNADNATVNFSSAEVEDMDIYDAIRITGRGDIKNMTVYKSGVKSSIKPDDLNTRNGASKPDYTSTSSGDIGYNSGSRYDDLTIRRDERTYSGGRYDDVRVMSADEWVRLKNMTIYGNLTIDEDVENGDVYLEDLDIRGNVYIYGGGENTISFEDCEIEGNIYARKDYGNRPVGIDIDSSTAKDLDGYISIEDNGAILKAGGKLDKVYVQTGAEVTVETNVENLYVSAKTEKLTIKNGVTVDKLIVSSNAAKNSTIKLDGNVKEISTNYDITVTGSGDYDKKTGSGTINGKEETIAVTGVTLNKTALTLTEGASEKLTATVKPDNATDNTVTWTSSNSSIAIVDANGKVTAVKEGTAKITAKAGDKTAECTVTVSKAATTIPVTGVGLNTQELKLSIGEAGQLTATVNPSDATNKEVEWNSSDESVAKVDSTGKVVGLSEGTAEITVTTKDGSKKATCAVNVIEPVVDVGSIKLNTNSLKLSIGEAGQLTATINPDTATNKELKWSSSDTSIATVDNTGKVLGISAGNTTITVETQDGSIKATCEVTVITPVVNVESVGLNTNSLRLSIGEPGQLTAIVNPSNAANKEVTWSSSNPSVATVDNTGKVLGMSAGNTTITVTTDDGEKTATCNVTVITPVVNVESVGLNTNSLSLSPGEASQLTAIVNPINATNKKVNWSSSNPAVATVDSTGKVSGLTAGGATITAETEDGARKITCNVTVKPLDTVINKSTSLSPGEGIQLGVSDVTKEAVISWSVANGVIAKVNETGYAVGLTSGTTTITATTTSGLKVIWTVTVI